MGLIVIFIACSFLSLGCNPSLAEPVAEPQPIIPRHDPEPTRPEPTPPEPVPQQTPRPFIPHDERDDARSDLAPPPELPAQTVDTPRATKLQPGMGRCRVDEDCVLTGYREGCCAPACDSYAINKQDLAARKGTENCEPYRNGNRVCSPPAPCPPRTTHARAATCVNRTCTALLELITD